MTPLDLAVGADLDAIGDGVGVPRTVMIPPRAGMTIGASAAALGKTLDALLDDLADATCGEFERMRRSANAPTRDTVLQWAAAWGFATRRRPRGRRSRQVRGQRARCAVRVERRDALRP